MWWICARPLRFTIDCVDQRQLLALRGSDPPPGVRVRCRRLTRWREQGPEQALRVEITVAGSCSARELALWLSDCFAGCQDIWYIDGVPARAGAHPTARELAQLVALFAP